MEREWNGKAFAAAREIETRNPGANVIIIYDFLCYRCDFEKAVRMSGLTEAQLKAELRDFWGVMETPAVEDLQRWVTDGGCYATDGCWVEPDGTCEHGCQSWMLELGYI
jgi:hypothetical protein